MSRLRTNVLFSIALASLISNVGYAHLKWFEGRVADLPEQTFALDGTSIAVIIGAVLFCVLAILIQRSRLTARAEKRFLSGIRFPEEVDWRIIAFLSGIMLIGNAVMKVFLAPNLHFNNDNFILLGQLAQGLVGLMLLANLTYAVPGILILVAAVFAAFTVPLLPLLDYVFEFGALAIALILIGPKLSGSDRRCFQRVCKTEDVERHFSSALPVLRIGVGLTLITLALHNKFLNPTLTVAVVSEYELNFMHVFGFTDVHFAFSAAVTELTFGLLILAGVATRTVVATLSVFFILTLIVFGPVELLGHLPLLGVALLLVLRGSGKWRLLRAPYGE
jgi:uncharacterized membrane protein YphA (DoxX/SURF4 family)